MLIEFFTMTSALALPDFAPILDKYPIAALRKDQSAAAVLELTVDPQGRRIDCTTVATFGDERLAKDICKLQDKAEIVAAHDSLGNPTYGVLRMLVRYSIVQTEEGREIYRLKMPGYTHTVTGLRFEPGNRPRPFREYVAMVGTPRYLLDSDAVFTVASLPGVDGRLWYQNLIIEVDDKGKIANCQEDAKFSSSTGAAYAKAACAQLVGSDLEPLVVRGQAVAHVRRYEVQFRLADEPETAPTED